jgi:hypothetical protein
VYVSRAIIILASVTTSTKPETPVSRGRSDIGEPTTDISLLAQILAARKLPHIGFIQPT